MAFFKFKMNKEYDAITAFHYAAYRPFLHSAILKSRLGSELYNSGLDIGCGTGQSTIALAEFCHSVIGIDPSLEMISKGIAHPKISYLLFDKNRIESKDNTFDIITLAGSLYYAKSQELINEIVRVGDENAMVLVYDFEVLLEDILTKIGFDMQGNSLGFYNHMEDFSGLNTDKILRVDRASERVQIQIATQDLAHLVLSVKEQYDSLVDLYGSRGLYEKIGGKLSAISDSKHFDIQVNTFTTVYRLH